MASMLFALILLSSLAVFAQALPSAEEIALREAINGTATTFNLTADVILSEDLPLLADKKTLTVRSADIPGAPFKIDGQGKFLLFRSAPEAIVKLTLENLIVTGGKESAVDIGGEKTGLRVENVDFVDNERALNLYIVKGHINNSRFSGHTKSAIVTQSEEGLGDDVRIISSLFSNNSAEPGSGGGAIRVLRYASVTVQKSNFSQNSADYRGGALRLYQAFGRIRKAVFSDNTANEGGGAISIYNSGLQVSGATFERNVAKSLGGGAVRISADEEGAIAWFKSTKFINNSALTMPGGAFVLDTYSEIVLCKTTFSGNTGKEAESNGRIVGINNTLSVYPEINIPAITVAPDATIEFGDTTCP